MIKGTCPYCYNQNEYTWMSKINKFMCNNCGKLFAFILCGKCGRGWTDVEMKEKTFLKRVWVSKKDKYDWVKFSNCCGSDNLVIYKHQQRDEPQTIKNTDELTELLQQYSKAKRR